MTETNLLVCLYMEEDEEDSWVLQGTLPNHWFRYVNNTLVKMKTHSFEAFSDHNNSVDYYIKFTVEDTANNTFQAWHPSLFQTSKQSKNWFTQNPNTKT